MIPPQNTISCEQVLLIIASARAFRPQENTKPWPARVESAIYWSARGPAQIVGARPPVDLTPTRSNYSRERRTARPAGSLMRALYSK